MIFDTRIDIYYYTTTQDTTGEGLKTSVLLASVWASKDVKSGREIYQASQNVGITDTMFLIRYLSGLDQSMTITHDSDEYRITALKEVGRRQLIEIHCQRKDNE